IRTEPVDPVSLSPAGALGKVIRRLLEKDPGRRYASAGEVVAALRAAIEDYAAPAGALQSLADWPARSWRVAIPAAVGLAVLCWFGARSLTPPPALTAATPAAVAVLPFEDHTGEEGSTQGRMVADVLAAAIGQSGFVRPVGSERVA